MYTCRADLQIPNAPSLFGTANVTIQGQLAIGTTVTVIQPSPPDITDPPRPVITTISSSVSLTCLATGSPDLLFTWFKDNEQIPNTRLSHYNIPSVTPGDRGYYHCTATNDVVADTSDQALLHLVGVWQYRVGFALSWKQ